MSRYTLITTLQDSLHEECRETRGELVDAVTRSLGNIVAVELDPCLIITLSNGISEEDHSRLFSELSSKHANIRIVSVLHDIPLIALYKAIQFSKKYEYFFERGTENDYLLGLFEHSISATDPVAELIKRLDLLYYVATSLLNTGSLVIHMDLSKLVAVLNKQQISQYEGFKGNIKVRYAEGRDAHELLEDLLS